MKMNMKQDRYLNKEGEAEDDIGKEAGTLQTAIQKYVAYYVDKKDSDNERKKTAA